LRNGKRFKLIVDDG
jgi:hypothetical protein